MAIKDENLRRQIAKHIAENEDPVYPRAYHMLASIHHESTFNPKANARGSSAIGLMQIKPDLHDTTPDALVHDVGHSIQLGANILRNNYKRIGDIKGAFSSYLQGVAGYKKKEKASNYEEGKEYGNMLMQLSSHYKGLLGD